MVPAILPFVVLLLLAALGACTVAALPAAAPPPAAEHAGAQPVARAAPLTQGLDTSVRAAAGDAAGSPGSGQPAGPAKNPPVNTSLTTFTTTDFSGSGICASCHINLSDQSGADVSMPTMWRSTMMANAARDPIWQAKVSSEVQRAPALQEIIEKKCTTCHMPMAETQAVTDNQRVAALGDGFYNSKNALHEAGMDAVSCTLCHQIVGGNFGTVESFSGGYKVDTSTNPPDRPIYGPYEEPVADLMKASTGFTPEYGVHMDTAEHCATCHNLYTPYVDAAGNVLGEFPEQTPYTEWQNSMFGSANQSCQSCHMPKAQGGVKISSVPADLQARQPFFQHFFVGGNAVMLKVLRDRGGDLGVTADVPQFNATLDRVGAQVGQRAATLALDGLDVTGETLTAKLKVAVMTGHKFPTSFPSRRAWLHVTVKDAAGNVVFESGAPGKDGKVEGNVADTDPKAYEPHYDVVTAADQVQIYEPIMGDNEGNVTYQLLRGATYLKDNRLLPAGADKAKLPKDIAVYGEAASDKNFVGGGDLVTYQVAVKGASGPFTVSADLLYEPLSYRFVQDLLADKTDLTRRFEGMYDQVDKAPLVAASITPAQTK